MSERTLVQTCPRCGKSYTEYPALSRRDNETDICSDCGNSEAFEDAGYAEPYNGKPYWNDKI
jgi:transcription elongation factor Elf1